MPSSDAAGWMNSLENAGLQDLGVDQAIERRTAGIGETRRGGFIAGQARQIQ